MNAPANLDLRAAYLDCDIVERRAHRVAVGYVSMYVVELRGVFIRIGNPDRFIKALNPITRIARINSASHSPEMNAPV